MTGYQGKTLVPETNEVLWILCRLKNCINGFILNGFRII